MATQTEADTLRFKEVAAMIPVSSQTIRNLVTDGLITEIPGGERSFRRRLLELGLLPGAEVRVLRVAPLGDPFELFTRGTNLSIRRREAQHIEVRSKSAARAEAEAKR